MSLINIENLSFCYPGSYDNIFENVSFQIDTDWKLGFTGRNGRGKTTFLNLLLGKYAYSGKISTNTVFEYFPYAINNKTISTLEVIHNICPNCADWQIKRELSLLAIENDTLFRSFATLSNGEQTKCLLAALFLKENRFLLIDEPTNHLDTAGRNIVSDYLKQKKGFILVSHDRTLLDNCIDHILAINKTNIEIQQGNFSSWWQNKQQQDNLELAENQKLRNEIDKLSVAAKRTARWSADVEKTKFGTKNSGIKPDKGYIGSKSAKMMKRSQTIAKRQQTAIAEKAQLLHNIEDNPPLKLSQIQFHTAHLLDINNITISYGTKIACENISFAVEQGDRIAICGKNGCGKSSLLKLIYGEDLTYQGTISKNRQLKISYVCQNTDQLNGTLTDYAKRKNIDESIFKTNLRQLDFSRDQFAKNIEDFSEGQKKKVLLAGSLCEKAHLYLWDEPLNFIDVISRIQIEEAILKYQPTIIFVEHDQNFCQNIATKTIYL